MARSNTLCWGLTLVALSSGTVWASDPSSLGPGSGAWEFGDPSDHGLDAAELADAASRMRDAVLHRFCFLVVKDGKIMQENYFSNNSETLYRTQSLGKTMIGALLGVPVTEGKLDLNRPIHSYGVPDTGANWSKLGTNWYPNVTTKHLLGQSSGYGIVQPGSHFTYDSDDYIQYLSYVLEAATGEEPVSYATREFAEPLGIPSLFAYDGQLYNIGGNISTGGGQMMSCRDVARVGTLIVNKGMWRDGNGNPTQLVSEEYMEQLSTPSFPSFNTAYGYLTWLNANTSSTGAHCCGPRWSSSVAFVNQTGPSNENLRGTCCIARNSSITRAPKCNLSETKAIGETTLRTGKVIIEGSEYIESSIIDDNTPEGLPRAPHDLLMAQGQDGQYMYMIPSLNLTVVTMGSSDPSSQACANGYDDAFLVSLAWNAIAPAFTTLTHKDSDHRQSRQGKAPNRYGSSTFKKSIDRPDQGPRYHAVDESNDAIVGSCTCDCPVNLGYGRCFDVPESAMPRLVNQTTCYRLKKDSTVARQIRSPANYCPALGRTIGCDPKNNLTNATSLCASGFMTHRNCRPVMKCSTFPGMSPHFAVTTCNCPVSQWAFSPCVWSTQRCTYSPYYPPP